MGDTKELWIWNFREEVNKDRERKDWKGKEK